MLPAFPPALLALRAFSSGATELLRTSFPLTAVDIIVAVSAVCLLLVVWSYVAIVLFAGLRHLNILKRSIIRFFSRSSSSYSCASLPISTMSHCNRDCLVDIPRKSSLACQLPPILFGSVDELVTNWYFNAFSMQFEYVPGHNRYQVRQSNSSESPASSKATKFSAVPSSPASSDRSITRIRSIPCIGLVPKQGASKQVSWSEPTYIQYTTKEDILEHLPDWPEQLRIDSSNAKDEVHHILSHAGKWVCHVEERCGCLSDELHSLFKSVNTYRTTCELDVFIEACIAWKKECIKQSSNVTESACQQVLEAQSIIPSPCRSAIKNGIATNPSRVV